MSEHKFGIFYVITRIVLAVLTAIAVVGIIIAIVEFLSNDYRDKVGFLIWAVVCLAVSITGFWGAWKEHFMSCMLYGIIELILLLAGISFANMRVYTQVTQVLAVICAFIFSWMLYVGGRADYSLPCNV